MYFLISSCADGTRIVQMDHAKLLKELNEKESDYKVSNFVRSIPDSDPQYWGDQNLLIKGEIVVPKAKEVVTKVEVE